MLIVIVFANVVVVKIIVIAVHMLGALAVLHHYITANEQAQ